MEASHSVGGVELTATQETYTFDEAVALMEGDKVKVFHPINCSGILYRGSGEIRLGWVVLESRFSDEPEWDEIDTIEQSDMDALWVEVKEPEALVRETYTFSRALHLMNYSNAVVRPSIDQGIKYRVKDGKLQHSWQMGNEFDEIWYDSESISASRLMGSWVEVK